VEEVTPTPDPWDVFQQLARQPRVIFFDSALRHPELGRYSFLTADPFAWVLAQGRKVEVSGLPMSVDFTDPFAALVDLRGRFEVQALPGLPPFQGGAAGLFGYDLCHHLECLPRPAMDDFGVPDLAVGLYDWVVAFDHEAGRAWLLSTGLPETEPRRRRQRAERRLKKFKQWMATRPEPTAPPAAPRPAHLARQWPIAGLDGLTSNFKDTDYLERVRRAIEFIHAGDCFQINLAQRLLYPAHEPATELYRRLRLRNSAPFAGYFDLGEFVIASASPERFVRVRYGNGPTPDKVDARPIKGTRPRGMTPAKDRARIQELQASPKDRAENVMIVDLLRNDLGRVCRYGSVRVPALCRVETYRHVHHLVSEVCGQLRPGVGPIDLLRAAFPGGSVTGAPKIRAMEIIAELEPTARGPYCGSLGYIGFDGAMDTSILIRTFTIGKGFVQFPVGGGIVSDSVPQTEYEETWHKAEGMLRALRDTGA
jgi:para-aminobenzoate synthetase component 1